MNPIKGTEILFLENDIWYNKNSDGIIIPTNTSSYLKRYKLLNSLVVIKDEEDDKYISNLNNGELTVVVDKNLINRPNLLSYNHTKEWMSLTHYLILRKQTAAFCHMAKTFNVPKK